MGDGKENGTRAVGIIILKVCLPTACKLVCVVCRADALSARGMGEDSWMCLACRWFSWYSHCLLANRFFFPFFFPLVEEEETVGGKDRRGITHSHFPEWKRREATHQLNPCLHIITGSAFLCKYKSNGTDLGCFSLSCEDSLFGFWLMRIVLVLQEFQVASYKLDSELSWLKTSTFSSLGFLFLWEVT